MQQASNGCVQNGAPTTSSCTTTSTTTSSSENGHQIMTNGASEFFLDQGKQDIVRLIGQYLANEGLTQTAESLLMESGCRLDHPAAVRFQEHILEGDWTKADHDLQELRPLIGCADSLVKMKFLMWEQKYLEYLEDGRVLDALHVLRNELTPLQHNTARVHQLSSYMMCSSTEQLLDRSNWEGKGVSSRTILMNKLESFLPPRVMLPRARLNVLLRQALEYQASRCHYHNVPHPIPFHSGALLVDHSCSRAILPSYTIQIITDHHDEVWICQFSPDGSKLATGSKDSNIMIWDVNPDTCKLSRRKTLEGHHFGVAYLAWSPDSTHVIACGGSDDIAEVWLWNIETEKYLKVSQNPDDALTCCAWNKDGNKFVVGGAKGHFYQFDMDGSVLESWEGVRVNHLWCRQDGKTILAADSHYRIKSYVFDDVTDQHILQEDHPIMSFTVDKNDKFALLNVATQGVHLWDINHKVLVRKYKGVIQGHFTIHSSFGGPGQTFIASGSEDSKVYIWHLSNDEPLVALSGHTRTVNCVAWNPVHHHMMVSVSDDNTVRVWGTQDKLQKSSVSSSSSESSTNGTWTDMVS